MQAMRAVLDRPLRANFVSVSTALNCVAKLAAQRSRGGGLVNDEERKYLGILLKVWHVFLEGFIAVDTWRLIYGG